MISPLLLFFLSARLTSASGPHLLFLLLLLMRGRERERGCHLLLCIHYPPPPATDQSGAGAARQTWEAHSYTTSTRGSCRRPRGPREAATHTHTQGIPECVCVGTAPHTHTLRCVCVCVCVSKQDTHMGAVMLSIKCNHSGSLHSSECCTDRKELREVKTDEEGGREGRKERRRRRRRRRNCARDISEWSSLNFW